MKTKTNETKGHHALRNERRIMTATDVARACSKKGLAENAVPLTSNPHAELVWGVDLEAAKRPPNQQGRASA